MINVWKWLILNFKYTSFMATLGLHYVMQHYSDMVRVMYYELQVAKNNDMVTLTCDQQYVFSDYNITDPIQKLSN